MKTIKELKKELKEATKQAEKNNDVQDCFNIETNNMIIVDDYKEEHKKDILQFKIDLLGCNFDDEIRDLINESQCKKCKMKQCNYCDFYGIKNGYLSEDLRGTEYE